MLYIISHGYENLYLSDIGIAGRFGLRTVSYTHLDVYKRQSMASAEVVGLRFWRRTSLNTRLRRMVNIQVVNLSLIHI